MRIGTESQEILALLVNCKQRLQVVWLDQTDLEYFST